MFVSLTLRNMKFRALKYLTVFSAVVTGLISLTQHGWLTYLTPLYSFFLIPLFELLIPVDEKNLTEAEEEIVKNDRLYDWLVYAIVPIQWGFVVLFMFTIQDPTLSIYEIAGRILSLGVGCGAFGINVAHELGHRVNKGEQLLSKLLLLSSLYMHFFIEHNRGHHKNVSTDEDPASSRYGESLYEFIPRSMIMGYLSAWKIEAKQLKKEGRSFWSLHNEMIQYQLLQAGLLVAIYFGFGLMPMLYFWIAATIGAISLEIVNYIEHYGLRRKKTGENSYERTLPIHSWNSSHVLGRLMLFELSRHSDHHYKASRKYQLLKHYEEAPQMPTGYPGMMLLSTIPPLWFYVMHKRIAKLKAEGKEGLALA
jgi:alkane 1-monooxygenase